MELGGFSSHPGGRGCCPGAPNSLLPPFGTFGTPTSSVTMSFGLWIRIPAIPKRDRLKSCCPVATGAIGVQLHVRTLCMDPSFFRTGSEEANRLDKLKSSCTGEATTGTLRNGCQSGLQLLWKHKGLHIVLHHVPNSIPAMLFL